MILVVLLPSFETRENLEHETEVERHAAQRRSVKCTPRVRHISVYCPIQAIR